MPELHGLPFLRALMGDATARDSRSLYDPDRLRFALTVPAGGDTHSALRARLARLLTSDRFALEPLFGVAEPGEPETYVLAPHGVNRTLPEDVLFGIAAGLKAGLDLFACDPDLGGTAYVEPLPYVVPTTESVVLDATCWVQGTAPEPKTWALEVTRVPQAWALSPGKGKGIVIAQPDTGVTQHVELADTLFDFTRSLNLIEGGTQPTDPLKPTMSNPGHGTGTGSVVASGEGGQVKGSAPGATLVPIRCINDVKIFNGAPVARAIDHAVQIGAHVITLSLGGFWSTALRQAINRAIAQDVILLAAAGNCIPFVVWPAAYPEMIAVGGTNIRDRKWKGSAQGPAVAFSAPAELVWRASRTGPKAPTNLISGGQGTSFATALSAGIAALWLGHHGRDTVIAAARSRGMSVQAMFRSAVRQTARRPAGFPSGLGAGVIDAEALLRLPLLAPSPGSPPPPPPGLPPGPAKGPHPAGTGGAPEGSSVEDPSGGIGDALWRLFGPGRVDPDFDWDAHGAEVSALLIADARAGRGARGAARETRAFRRATPGLIEAAAVSRDPRLAQLALRGCPPAPSIVLQAPVDAARMARVLTGLGAAALPGISAEAAASISPGEGQARLDASGRREALKPLADRLERGTRTVDLDRLDRALATLHAQGPGARLEEAVTMELEALVSLTERPALAVSLRTTPDGRQVQSIDTTDSELGRFAGLMELARPGLEAGPLQAVGRIDGDGLHIGTGFVVGPGLVLTNRHVLEEFASPLPRAEKPKRWQMVRTATIDFSPTGNDPGQKFAVRGVAFAGPRPIQRLPISFAKLDMAILQVETVNSAGLALPQPFTINRDLQWQRADRTLFVVGFPAPPGFVPRDEQGALRHDVIDRLREIFGLNYRRKYFSPGLVQATETPQVFNHDATTLGGNSGSVVGALSGSLPAVGLHFAGDWLRANHAHDLAAVRSVNAGFAALVP